MTRVKTIEQALKAVSNSRGLSSQSFESPGYEGVNGFYFYPNDNQPEGTPAFWVEKESGKIVDVITPEKMDEIDDWLEKESTVPVEF